MPLPVFLAIALVSATAAAVNLARVGGWLAAGSFAGRAGVWRWYQLAAAVIGFSFIPQVGTVRTSVSVFSPTTVTPFKEFFHSFMNE